MWEIFQLLHIYQELLIIDPEELYRIVERVGTRAYRIYIYFYITGNRVIDTLVAVRINKRNLKKIYFIKVPRIAFSAILNSVGL